MRVLQDHQGRAIRLTDERWAHILEHPEMTGLETDIEETVASPDRVIQSQSDAEAELYYRWRPGTLVSDKYICVVVKCHEGDAFVITAYLTNSIKKGPQLWPSEE